MKGQERRGHLHKKKGDDVDERWGLERLLTCKKESLGPRVKPCGTLEETKALSKK